MPGISYSTGSSMVEDLSRRLVEDRQQWSQASWSCRLPVGPGHHDHAVRQCQEPRHDAFIARGKPELAHLQQPAGRRAASRRITALSECCVGMVATRTSSSVRADADPRRAVLRQPPLGNCLRPARILTRARSAPAAGMPEGAGNRAHTAPSTAHPDHEPGAGTVRCECRWREARPRAPGDR